jgi:hypothetical protein
MIRYRRIASFAVVFLISATTAYLQWHYHRSVDAGVAALTCVSLVGVVVSVRTPKKD